MEKRKYLAPERYEETAKLYQELSIEWRAAGNEERAERCAKMARAEAICAELARQERGMLDGWTRDQCVGIVVVLAQLDALGRVTS